MVPVTTPHDLKNEGRDSAPAPMTQLVRFIAESFHVKVPGSTAPLASFLPPPPPPPNQPCMPPPPPSLPDLRGARCFMELRLMPTPAEVGGLEGCSCNEDNDDVS